MSNALELFNKGDYTEFLSNLDGSCQSEDVLFAKGVALLHTKQYAAAANLFLENKFDTSQEEADTYKNAAVKSWLTSSLESGMQLMNDQNFESSMKVYSQMPLEDPIGDNDDAMYQKYNNQSFCLFNLKRFDEALQLLNSGDMTGIIQKCINPIMKQTENEYNLGIIHKQLKQYDLALEAFQRSLQVGKDTCDVTLLSRLYCEKVDVMLHLGKFTEVIPEITDALDYLNAHNAIPNVSSRLALMRAMACIQLDKFDDALTDLTSLAKEDSAPTSLTQDIYQLQVYCLEKKGSFHFQNEDFQLSAEAFDAALRAIAVLTNTSASSLSSSSMSGIRVNILFHLAMAHVKLGMHDTAEQKLTYLTQLLTVKPTSGNTLSEDDRVKYLLQSYLSLGQILMQRARALSDEDVEEEEEAGSGSSSLTKQETFALAVDAFKRACALRDGDVPIIYSLAEAQIKADQYADAKTSFSKILSLDSEHSDTLKAMEMCKSYEESLAEEAARKEQEEQEKKEAAEEEEKAAQKKKEEEERKAKTPVSSPPKSTYQSAAFPKFNSPQTTTQKTFGGFNKVSTPPPTTPTQTQTPTESTKDSDSVPDSTSTAGEVFYPYEQLKSPGPFPPGVTVDRELLLSPEDFMQVFKVSKADFAKYPGWKKISKKKAAGLF